MGGGELVVDGLGHGQREAQRVAGQGADGLLAAALVIAVYSFDPGWGIHARFGVPSDGYLLIGLLMSRR